jgi:hypothetical protein
VPFEISSGIVIPAGHHSFGNTRTWIQTADQRKVWISGAFQTGDFYGGGREEIHGEINWRPSGRLRTGLAYTFNEIDLPQDSFETRLVSLRTEVAFYAKLSWVTRIQYDNVSDRASLNMRCTGIRSASRALLGSAAGGCSGAPRRRRDSARRRSRCDPSSAGSADQDTN